MNWYWVFIGVAVPVLGVGWLLYWLHERKLDQLEQELPKEQKSSEKLQSTRSEVSDWAKKIAEFKPPKPPRQTGDAGGD